MDTMGELQTLIQTSGFSRAKLAALLREIVPTEQGKTPRQRKEPAPPVTVYKEIEKITTCLHCEASHSTFLKLKEGEDSVGITEEGKVMIINSNSPAKVQCVSSFCDSCYAYVKEMTRSELEDRYMILLTGQQRPKNYGKLFTKGSRSQQEEEGEKNDASYLIG